MQFDNHYLPPHRRGDVTPMSVTGGHPNAIRIMAPQGFFAHTNSVIQLGVYNELLLLFARGSRDTMHRPFRGGSNRGQQIPLPFMYPRPPPNLEAIREVV